MPRPRLSPHSVFFLAVLLLTLPLLSAQPAGSRRDGKHARQQIEALEEQWRSATLTADVATLDRLMSEDYVGIAWTGQVNTKALQIDHIRSRNYNITQLDLSDRKVKIVSTVAIVTCRADVLGTANGAHIDGGFRYTRIYQRTPSGTWKITNFEATRIPSGKRDHDHHHGQPPPPPVVPASPPTPEQHPAP